MKGNSQIKEETNRFLINKCSDPHKLSYFYEITETIAKKNTFLYLPCQQDLNKFVDSFLSLLNDYSYKILYLVEYKHIERYKTKYKNMNVSFTTFEDYEDTNNVGIVFFDCMYTVEKFKIIVQRLEQNKDQIHYFGLTCSPFLFIDAYKLRKSINIYFFTPVKNDSQFISNFKTYIEKSNLIPYEEDIEKLKNAKEYQIMYDNLFANDKRCVDFLVKNNLFCCELVQVLTNKNIDLNYRSQKLEVLNKILLVLKIRKNCLIVKNEKVKFLLAKYYNACDKKFRIKLEDKSVIEIDCIIKTHEDYKFGGTEECENYIIYDFVLLKNVKNVLIFCASEQKRIYKKILAAEEIIESNIKTKIKSETMAKNICNSDLDDKEQINDNNYCDDNDTFCESQTLSNDLFDKLEEYINFTNKRNAIALLKRKCDIGNTIQSKISKLINREKEMEIESSKDYSFEKTMINNFNDYTTKNTVEEISYIPENRYKQNFSCLFRLFMDNDIAKEIENDLRPIMEDFSCKDYVANVKIRTNNPIVTSYLLSKAYKIPAHVKNYSKQYYNHFGFCSLSFGHINFFDSFVTEKEFTGIGYLFLNAKKVTIFLFSNENNVKVEIEGNQIEKFSFVNVVNPDLFVYLPLTVLPKIYYCYEIEQKNYLEIRNLPFNKKLAAANELAWKRLSISEAGYMKNSYDIRIRLNLKNNTNKNTKINYDYVCKQIMQKYIAKAQQRMSNDYINNIKNTDEDSIEQESYVENTCNKQATPNNGQKIDNYNKQINEVNYFINEKKNMAMKIDTIKINNNLNSNLQCISNNLNIIETVIEKLGQYSQFVCFSQIKNNRRTGLKLEELKNNIFENYEDLSFSDFYSLEVLFCKKGKYFANKIQSIEFMQNIKYENILYFFENHVINRFKSIEMQYERVKQVFTNNNNKKQPQNLIRTAVITPFTVKFQAPQQAITNRVIRHFISDYFLKVSFKEEDNQQIKKGDKHDTTNIFECFKKYMKEGIVLGKRRYFFLAMSSSQLKLHSAWFIAPYFMNNNLIGADFIRTWLGDFKPIKNIGKYAMRLGQALSSTTDTIKIDKIWIMEDIIRNGYCFSDGIGVISYDKAKEVSKILKLSYVPSAFQIRIGGFKGVVSVYQNIVDQATDCSKESNACKTIFEPNNVNKKYDKYKKLCLEAIKKKPDGLNLTESYTWYKKLPLVRIDLTKSEETTVTNKQNDTDIVKSSKSYDTNTLGCTEIKPYHNKEYVKSTQYHENEKYAVVVKHKFYHTKNEIAVPENQPKEEITRSITKKDKLDEFGLLLRESMKKFESNHKILEVITHSQNIPGYLNRQIILILNSLGIPNSVFMDFLDDFIYNKLFCMNTLSKYISEFVFTENNVNENFYINMLEPVFNRENNDIVKKSKVFVCKSRILMGILDEHCLLKYDEVFIQCSPCKNCVCNNKNNQIITGNIAIAKNPCLHPGDVRIVKGVDIKELHYLKDVVVFSAQGDRPVFNMCSGSDLDGDCYFCTWEDKLIPSKTVKPDTYSSNTALYKEVVSMDDIINFYIKFIRENQLGLIANAHLAISDKLTNSVLEPESIKLAKLFNLGVDFPKTGFVARIPFDLQPEIFPDFMQQGNTYESNKILGLMYRRSLILSQIKYSNCECLERPTTYLQSVYEFKCRNIFRNNNNNEINIQLNYFEKETGQTFTQYKNEMLHILSKYSIEDENNAFLSFTNNEETDKSISQNIKEIIKKYKKIFNSNTETENKQLKESKMFFKAFSWYKISHEDCNNKFLSFGWINGSILNENIGKFECYKAMYNEAKNNAFGKEVDSKADNICTILNERGIKYKRFVYSSNIIFVEDIETLRMLSNNIQNNHFIDKGLLVVLVDFEKYKKIENVLKKTALLKETFLILFALRFFDIENFCNYFTVLKYFAKMKNDRKEVCKGFFELSKYFYVFYENNEQKDVNANTNTKDISNKDVGYNEMDMFEMCSLFDRSLIMQKSNALLAAAKIFSSRHKLGTKLIACEYLYFESKKKKYQKIDKAETSYKKKVIELVMHGMFDSFDRIFFVPYTGDCLHAHKDIKKYLPTLLNKGDCSVESYKDNLRSFLLNNAGFDTKKDTIITVKVYQGKYYFFNVSTYCINNNTLISEVEKLIENGENKRRNKETKGYENRNNHRYNNGNNNVYNSTYNNVYNSTYSSTSSEQKINKPNIDYNKMYLSSYFLNSHDLVKDNIEEYIKKEKMKVGKKEKHYEFIYNKDKKRYALYLSEDEMKVIKITKNRNICGKYYIVNIKDTLFEMVKEELIYDAEQGINKLEENEEVFLDCILEKKNCEKTNEIMFVINKCLDGYTNFRLEEYTTCKLSKYDENSKTSAFVEEERIYSTEDIEEIKNIQTSSKVDTHCIEKQNISSSFNLCIKKVYKVKKDDRMLELESTKMSCEGKVSKTFGNVNFRTFDAYFEEIWNVFLVYIDSIKK
ncbi:RNA-dependent RNA polymerase [Binucleata daphniae]